MRTTLMRALTSMTLAVAVVLPAAAQPAAAVDIGTIYSWVQKAYGLYKQFSGGGGLSIGEATTKIIAEIDQARTDILAHVDQVAVADARACTRAAVIDFADIERFTPDTLQAYARDATACVTLIDSRLSAVTDKASLDQLGFALAAIGPVSLVARSRAGFSTAGLVATLRTANTAVVAKLEPPAHYDPEPIPGGYYQLGITAVAYNGYESYVGLSGYFRAPFPSLSTFPTQVALVKDGASATISRSTSQAALPLLPA
ncbi:hypothetical protein [Actinosynnema sp. NPDC020468]|uniref:hypothetical protein n=1 Tax=Actinosynnema sp. NPDC020468 TaxID=3154488 RepID=UPI0033EB8B7C